MLNSAREVPNIKNLLSNKDEVVHTEEDKAFINRIKYQKLHEFCRPSIDKIEDCIINNTKYQEEMEKYNTKNYILPQRFKNAPEHVKKQLAPLNTSENYYPADLSIKLFRACDTILFESCKSEMEKRNMSQYFRV